MSRYFLLLCLVFLSGCATKLKSFQTTEPPKFIEAKVTSDNGKGDVTVASHFEDYIVPSNPQPDAVLTSTGFGDSPALVAAYRKYLASGVSKNVEGEGLTTLAYSIYKTPLLQCAPLQLCQIILGKGEIIQDMAVGDPVRWELAKMYMGDEEAQDGSYIISIKPSEDEIATNMTITTDKCLYRFRLLGNAKAISPTINFWYPEDTLGKNTQAAKRSVQKQKQAKDKLVTEDTFAVHDTNFNYGYTGDSPVWKPKNVFDNGSKTYIQFAEHIASVDLPVAFVSINAQQSIVNHRFKMRYMILDGVFKEIFLISGSGKHKKQITIVNQGFKE